MPGLARVGFDRKLHPLTAAARTVEDAQLPRARPWRVRATAHITVAACSDRTVAPIGSVPCLLPR
jgi:hypothetical protein